MATTYGSKRLVVGAHYGLKDWLIQRATAVLIALYVIVLVLRIVCTRGPLGYEGWVGVFTPQWMKVLTFVVILSLVFHVWIGVRDIWMDYVKPVSIKLFLHVFTIAWLVGCAGWAIQVLWGMGVH